MESRISSSPQIILMGVAWKHTLLDASLYHKSSFANPQKSRAKHTIPGVMHGYLDWAAPNSQSRFDILEWTKIGQLLLFLRELSLLIVFLLGFFHTDDSMFSFISKESVA